MNKTFILVSAALAIAIPAIIDTVFRIRLKNSNDKINRESAEQRAKFRETMNNIRDTTSRQF